MEDGTVKNVLAFYHKGDLDGVSSAAIICEKFSGITVDLVGVEYGDTIDEMGCIKDTKYDYVFVVDFTFEPFNRMIELNNKCNLIWIDHHKTSPQEVEKSGVFFAGVLGDNTKSAAYLTWEYLFGDKKVPDAIEKISLFDTWQHNFVENTLNYYIGLEAYSDMSPRSEIWHEVFSTPSSESVISHAIRHSGLLIRKYLIMKDAGYATDHVFETEFEGHKALVMNSGFPGSTKFNSVYDPSEHELLISFSRRKNHVWKISLYSDNKNVDCSEIAKKHGGGGHRGSAGFETTSDVLPFKI